MADEIALMQAIQDGDTIAYDAAVRQHLQSISRYAFRMLGNSKDTEDITQETFLRLWTHAHTFNSAKASLTTWLHRIAHNLCIDYLRKDKPSVSSDLESIDELETDTQDEDESPERLAALKQAISTLPERQRSALVLNHYHGFSNKQTAEILNISVDALESVLARARRALKLQLIDKSKTKITAYKAPIRIQEKS
jgi:RNA polymerase sigma-70 factor (ECF subfamily)